MQHTPFKIVISGSVGSGKTTLAKALGQALNLPVLTENLRGIYRGLETFRQYAHNPQSSTHDKQRVVQKLMQQFTDWTKDRQQLYQQHPGFIADRWEADLVDLWLKLFADLPCDAQTEQLLVDMRQKAHTFTCAVMLPPYVFQAEAENEDGLKRRQSMNLTLLSSLVTSGLHRQCPGLHTLHLSPKIISVEDRVAHVLDYARQHHANLN